MNIQDTRHAQQQMSIELKPDPTRERIALATTSSAHFLHDGIADSLYVLLPIWAQAFGLNFTQVGVLKSAYSVVMATFQMPAGIMAENYSERTLLVAGTLVAGAAFAGLAIASGFIGLFLTIMAIGFGSAVQHPLASAIISQAYPPERRRTALGVYNFAGDVGKMAVAFGVSTVAGIVGWQATVAGYGAVVALAALLLFVVLWQHALGVRRSLSPRPGNATSAELRKGLQLTDARGFSLLSLVHGLDSAGRTGALTLLPFVLMQKGAPIATIGVALACIFAGGAAGKLVCGLLADRIGILRTVIVTEFATAACLLAALVAPLGAVLALMPLLGVALNGTSSVLYGTVTDFVHADRQARAFGLFYTVGSAAGGASPIVFGVTSDWIGLTQSIVALSVVILSILPVLTFLRPHLSAR